MAKKSQLNPDVAIIDYGMGNLYSVYRACQVVGLKACVTSRWSVAQYAHAIILPGVGAFGNAMSALRALDMEPFLQDFASSGRILVGICLGIQLLMTESCEFGVHRGLNIVEGTVNQFSRTHAAKQRLKVPHIGWNRICSTESMCSKIDTDQPDETDKLWKNTLLTSTNNNEFFYFVHSFYVQPSCSGVSISYTRYGDTVFPSTLQLNNIFACQYHPERSGPCGLKIYLNLANRILSEKKKKTGGVVNNLYSRQ